MLFCNKFNYSSFLFYKINNNSGDIYSFIIWLFISDSNYYILFSYIFYNYHLLLRNKIISVLILIISISYI